MGPYRKREHLAGSKDHGIAPGKVHLQTVARRATDQQSIAPGVEVLVEAGAGDRAGAA